MILAIEKQTSLLSKKLATKLEVNLNRFRICDILLLKIEGMQPMKALTYLQDLTYNIRLARIPITMMHLVVLIGSLCLQSTAGLSIQQTVQCILLFIMYTLIHWCSDTILPKLRSLYFYLQGLIILFCTIIMPDASPIIVLGLMPIFMIQGMFYFQQAIKLVLLVLGYMVFYSIMMYIHFGVEYLWLFIALFVIIFVFLNLVLYLFNQKDAENMELQYYIKELQTANKKIGELTLQNERQRMARDLHDTLAQRLVGLILKLDASEAHLKKGNVEKVEMIILSAKEQAKESLADARKVIDNLRLFKADESFPERATEEIAQLQFLYNIPISLDMVNAPALTAPVEEHILSILKEAVTNVYKHANATKVSIAIEEQDGYVIVRIADDGNGIAIDRDLQKLGHYGILGMEERVKLIQGRLTIENVNGTCITLTIPLK